MGSDAGHTKIEFRDYTNNEILTVDSSGNLTLSGTVDGVDINSLASTSLTAAPGSNHTASGPQCNDINTGESIIAMNCVYLKSDGKWWKTSASGETTGAGMLAISLESKAANQIINVALPGTFIRNDSWTWDMNENSRILYVSCTSGDLTQTVVSGINNVIRIVGHATHANRIFFNPEQTIVIHT
jgi:hypothetical protein